MRVFHHSSRQPCGLESAPRGVPSTVRWAGPAIRWPGLAARLPGLAAIVLCLCLLPASQPVSAVAPAEAARPADPTSFAERPFVVESIEATGNDRTSLETILLYFPLHSGDRVDQQAIIDAVTTLRGSEIFAAVQFFTRPGTERGRLIIVLEVQEKGVEFRLGTGNSDLDGWYLIPAQLAFDNRFGRGERMDLQLKFGYRHLGFLFAFDEPRLGDGESYWGFQAGAYASERVYFFQQAEYRHKVGRGAASVYLGRRFASPWYGEIGMRFETIEADSFATVGQDDEELGLERGDKLPWEELPADVAKAAGRRKRTVLHLDLGLDSRGSQQIAGSPTSGLWGRVRGEGFLQGDDSFFALSLDLRGYQGFLGGVLTGRVRGATVGGDAAFYDRLYLGGLYTVRGFPSQSLTRPGGDLWLWSASCEWRAPLVGDRARPRLAGVLFLDVGDSGSDNHPSLRDVSMSAGYGLRLRVAWLGWIGLDFGIPLSYSPVGESYRAHASIGWTF